MCETVTGWQIHVGLCSVADADAHSKGSWNYQVWGDQVLQMYDGFEWFLRKKYCIVWGWSYNEPCTSNVLRLPLGYTHVRQIAPPWAMHENVKCLVSTFFLCHKWAEAPNPQSKKDPTFFGLVFQKKLTQSIVFQICLKGRFFSQNDPFFLMNSHGTIGTFDLWILPSSHASPKATDSSASSCFASGGLRFFLDVS